MFKHHIYRTEWIKMQKIVIFTAFLFLITNCSDHIVSECVDNNYESGVIQTSTFTEIQNQILTSSCATTGCHSGNNPEMGLNLSLGLSYTNLVNVKSNQRSDLNYVTPGNSARSYLIQKLNGQNTSVMPPSGKLSAALIDSVAKWIDAGALNN